MAEKNRSLLLVVGLIDNNRSVNSLFKKYR